MNALYSRLTAATVDGLIAAGFVAVVVVLCLTAYWLVPFEWTPPRVAA
jgi:hypothetical protein